MEQQQERRPLIPHPARRSASASSQRQGSAAQESSFPLWLGVFLMFLLGTCFGFLLFPFMISMIFMKVAKNINDPGQSGTPHRYLPAAPGIKANTTTQGVKFSDIAGIDEAKEELHEVVEFLRDPMKFAKLGAKLPKGVLLVGPPGTGKTQLARAVANEAGTPFLWASGSEFVELYVGQGARRVRDLFNNARSKAPCIVFIDEIDSIGFRREAEMSGGGREYSQTLNQILTEMDGFNSTRGIVVLGATNRLDILDPALLRPGRFDRHIFVPLPDIKGREQILQIYMNRVPHNSSELNLHTVAKATVGFSGADLENLVNEGALLAARDRSEVVNMTHLLNARDKISIGPQRKSMVITENQKRLTAYHEAGHALVAFKLQPHAHPIHKATIVPRGGALGYVEQMPEEDLVNYRRSECEARLAVAMAGRVAEEIVFGRDAVTTGASSDFEMATGMAIKMVSEWGMSDKVGPVHYGIRGVRRAHAGLDPHDKVVEQEVKRLVEDAKKTAERILKKNRRQLDRLANALLENETLSGEEISDLLDRRRARRKARLEKMGGGTLSPSVAGWKRLFGVGKPANKSPA
ncbi:unnamed protein product [Vitrella brassicaformis CCMP3155]|uniref:AAA+ ATPase domain-containing protein n=1 Tax=Vitrella brassicaformis (strain CCMP3155) TaxID=1169540 RepID=A0A0G4FU71_VITBC|nr:unnamed protein product [Vitrella brassicaformis CCMP3155]|eukprot:CEM17849.1 unnamed protein product [Vitrella brassicaformis CCMP3155]